MKERDHKKKEKKNVYLQKHTVLGGRPTHFCIVQCESFYTVFTEDHKVHLL